MLSCSSRCARPVSTARAHIVTACAAALGHANRLALPDRFRQRYHHHGALVGVAVVGGGEAVGELPPLVRVAFELECLVDQVDHSLGDLLSD